MASWMGLYPMYENPSKFKRRVSADSAVSLDDSIVSDADDNDRSSIIDADDDRLSINDGRLDDFNKEELNRSFAILRGHLKNLDEDDLHDLTQLSEILDNSHHDRSILCTDKSCDKSLDRSLDKSFSDSRFSLDGTRDDANDTKDGKRSPFDDTNDGFYDTRDSNNGTKDSNRSLFDDTNDEFNGTTDSNRRDFDNTNDDFNDTKDSMKSFLFGTNKDLHDSADNIQDGSKPRGSLIDWDQKFEEWRTPKKRIFLEKLMQSINRTEEWMRNETSRIFNLPTERPRDRHRSSINGQLVPAGGQVNHPQSPKHSHQNKTEQTVYNAKKNSLSNDSLAFTMVYCSVFLVTLFYIGFKLTKKWRRQDQLEAEGAAGTGHTSGGGGYPCNHTLCREARERNMYMYAGPHQHPHNTAYCDNSCENCRRLNQPPPSYSKVCLDESDPPAYTDDMDRQCSCRRSQSSRVSLCLFQNNPDQNTSQDSHDLERSASAVAAPVGTSSPRPGSSSSAPPGGPASATAPVSMGPAPSYAEFPKPGERKRAGHTRASTENLPSTSAGSSERPLHHAIFTVDEESSSDDDNSTVNTPILYPARNGSSSSLAAARGADHDRAAATANYGALAPCQGGAVADPLTTAMSAAPLMHTATMPVLASTTGKAVEQPQQVLSRSNTCAKCAGTEEEPAAASCEPAAGNGCYECGGQAARTADCLTATSAVESSSIILERSR